MRTLEEIANATPADYLAHVPADPKLVAYRMVQAARSKFPKVSEAITTGTSMSESTYTFLFVGPGSGLVVNELIALEQIANGLETSRRGISAAPEGVRGYIQWTTPWDLPYPTGVDGRRVKYFDVCIVNKFMKTLLTPEEWNKTVEQLKQVSKYLAIL